MNITCKECQDDFDAAIDSLNFTSNWKRVSTIEIADLEPIAGTPAHSIINDIRSSLLALRTNENMIFGGVLLYAAGRFEAYVKDVIIEICDRLVVKAGTYAKLPKPIRNNLPKYTGIVIQDPRKYGHAEAGVASFIKVMNENLSGNSPLSKINTECLIITETNLRPDAIIELFKRIGFESILERIAAQSNVMTHFETDRQDKSLSDLKSKLNTLMDLRNSIAHPKPTMIWPSKEIVIDYIEFLKIIVGEFDGQSNVHVASYNPSA